MKALKTLLLAPFVVALTVMPSLADPPSARVNDCMAPAKFLTALTSAGDWIVKRDPVGVADTDVTGIIFREAGMINVALFKQGCLAMVVIVGKAIPDIQV